MFYILSVIFFSQVILMVLQLLNLFCLGDSFFNQLILLLTFVGNIYSRLGQSADIQYSLAVWVGLGLFW